MTSTRFVTGASRGFGRELTEQLLACGDRVAATLRQPEQLDDLVPSHGDRLWVRALDVTDTARLRELFYEAFAPEVAPFGIRTTLIEPGMIRTSFYDSPQRAPALDAYADNPAVARDNTPPEQMPGGQVKVVGAMIDVAQTEDPHAALTERLAAYEVQKDLAYSTDADAFSAQPRPRAARE